MLRAGNESRALRAWWQRVRRDEDTQVARRLGLRNLQRVVNVADADFPGHQQTQDAETRCVGERLEQSLELGQLIRLRFGTTRYGTLATGDLERSFIYSP